MKQLSSWLAGPWRAVVVLGVTQIIAWGVLFYPPVLMLPLLAAERGWSLTFAMGGFSGGLLVAGLAAPRIGSAIDRYGGHWVMAAGSLMGAAGLALIVVATHPLSYLGVWALLGLAMAASLYDPAFATLGRIFGAQARRPITALTLAGGFASTVGWPSTQWLNGAVGWSSTYLIYAALLALVAAPLHAFLLPRERFTAEHYADRHTGLPPLVLPAKGWPFVLIATGFAVYAFAPSGLAAHLLAIFDRANMDVVTATTIGALFGPAQVGARLCEFAFARNVHPLNIARFALALLLLAFVPLLLVGFSVAMAALFVIAFGAANGLVTIARGAVPLALFGAVGYGRLLGRIGKPFLIMQAIAPLVLALVIERSSDFAALLLTAAFTGVALVCFVLVRRPKRS